MVDQVLNRVVIRRVCLNDDGSRLIASAGSARDLAQQLKGSLAGAKVAS